MMELDDARERRIIVALAIAFAIVAIYYLGKWAEAEVQNRVMRIVMTMQQEQAIYEKHATG